MRALGIAGLLLTTPAAAGPLGDGDTRQGALREEVAPEVSFEPAKLHLRWQLDATAASLVSARGDTVGTVSAGAEVAVAHEYCDIAMAGGQVDASAGDGAPLSAQQWASLCPIADTITFQLSHLLQWDVTPTLLAAPRQRPDASRRETITISMSGRSEQLNDPGPLTFLPTPPAPEYMTFIDTTMSLSIGWTADSNQPGDAALRADVAFLGFRRERDDDGPPLTVEVIASTMESNMAYEVGPFTMMARLDAFRFAGARWRGLRWGASLGFGLISILDGEMPAPGREPRSASVWAGEGGLSVERDLGDTTLRLAGDRVQWGLWDGRAVIDDRVSFGIADRGRRLRLRSEVFAAHSHVFSVEDVSTGTTGGFTGIAETDLGRHAVLRVRSDAGRGFYADGASFERPRWAAEVLATVALRLGNADRLQ